MKKIKNIVKKPFFFLSQIYNWVIFKVHGVSCGKGVQTVGRIGIYRSGNLHLGNYVTINSCRYANPLGDKMIFEIKKGADVFIGDYSGISGTIIKANKCVKIDEYVNIGAGCIIMDTDSHSLVESERRNLQEDELHTVTKPVHIESGAFIGTHSIILKGVTIGSGSVIGAGSVVTKSVPAGEVWAGNPARFVKKLGD